MLQPRDIDRPAIDHDEVLIRVHAASVDRGVWHLMTGLPYVGRIAFGLRAPKTPVPGMDLAGVVEAVGERVTRFRPGDEVFGIGKGSVAEYAAAPERKLAPKPANATFEQAAAIGISGSTLYRHYVTTATSHRGNVCSSSVRPAAWGHTPCSWPRTSGLRSPVSAAPARSIWSSH